MNNLSGILRNPPVLNVPGMGDKSMTNLIAERYEIRQKLGAGGMGTVYAGLDTHTQQPVAIKVLKPEIAEPANIERFKREGEALRALNHPNIVKMLDAVEFEDRHYLIMEFVEGGDLRDLLSKEGKLDYKRCADMAIDLTDALTRAHRLQIIHRDLKPANVLISIGQTLRLTDFGVARVGSTDRITDSSAIVGTLDYMPPEVLTGQGIDQRTDIWALGIILVEMLTGIHPFGGESITDKINSILVDPLLDLEALIPDVPVSFIDLIYRMLEKDYRARIRSIRQVGLELENIFYERTPSQTRFNTPQSEIAFFLNTKHNLPAQTSAFVGRDQELSQLSTLLGNPVIRFVTVVAPGGMGKTRLSLEASHAQIGNFHDGVYFVELAPLNDPADIITAIADAVGYQFQSDERELIAQIMDFLAQKEMLLLLDNFEHLIVGVSTISSILSVAPNVKVLVTSRQRLNVSGETVLSLAGMDFPEWESTEHALEYSSVQLFLQSAKRVQPHFEFSTDNMDNIGHICWLVQGMPLGIVLAASWLSMLTTAEIAEEIAQGADFLESDMGDLPARHRSLRAVFEYSWNLMSNHERDTFMKLSVFRGGFTREAAQSVAKTNLKTLMNLANKSLIKRNVDSGRYEIHELLRQYAYERLQTSHMLESTLQSHMTYFAKFINQHESNIKAKGNQVRTLEIVERDIENLKLAWHCAIQLEEIEVIDDLISGIFQFYDMRGLMIDGEKQFHGAVEMLRSSSNPTALNESLAKLLTRQAKFLFSAGDHEGALHLLQDSLSLLDNTSNLNELAFTLNALADIFVFLGDFSRAQELCKQSLALFRKLKDKLGIAASLNNLGVGEYHLGNHDVAISHYKESLTISQEIGDEFGAAAILSNWGAIEHDLGNYVEAKKLYSRSFDISQRLRDQYGVVSVLLNIGWTSLVTDELDDAYTHTLQGLTFAKKLGNRWLIATSQLNLGIITCEMGDLRLAHEHLCAAYSMADSLRAHHLMIDVAVGTAQLMIKEGQYTEAIVLLTYGQYEGSIEQETKNRIQMLFEEILSKGVAIENTNIPINIDTFKNLMHKLLT